MSSTEKGWREKGAQLWIEERDLLVPDRSPSIEYSIFPRASLCEAAVTDYTSSDNTKRKWSILGRALRISKEKYMVSAVCGGLGERR